MRKLSPRTHNTCLGIALAVLAGATCWLGWSVSKPEHITALPQSTATPANARRGTTSAEAIKPPAQAAMVEREIGEIEKIRHELAVMDPIQPGEIENHIAMDLLRRWAKLDPVAAIQFAGLRRDLHGRDAFATELLIAWMAGKPGAAMTWVTTMHDSELRSQLLPAVISLMAQENPSEALRLATELGGHHRERALGALFAEWAENDIQAAAAAAHGMTSPSDRATALHHVATQWADRDPAAAMKWIRTTMTYDGKSDVDFAKTALGLVLAKWAAKSPEEAAQFALASAHGVSRTHMLATAAEQWAGQDPAAALKWAAALRDAADRDATAATVLARVGESNVSSAASLALTLPPGSARDRSLSLLLGQWSATNSAEASIWATHQFKSGDSNALTSIVRAWADSDVQSLGKWLNTLPDGRLRDEGFATLAHHLVPAHPDLAARWADAISDPGLRQQTATALRTGR